MVTQQCERTVKRCNHVDLDVGKKRSEQKHSMMAVANNDIVSKTSIKKKMKSDATREVWVQGKGKSDSIMNYTVSSTVTINEAKNSFTE